MMMFLEVRDAPFHSLFYSQVYFPLLARSTLLYLQPHPIPMPAAHSSANSSAFAHTQYLARLDRRYHPGFASNARVPSRAATSARLFLISTKLETTTNTTFRWQTFDLSSTSA
jgi:hypothetical protein